MWRSSSATGASSLRPAGRASSSSSTAAVGRRRQLGRRLLARDVDDGVAAERRHLAEPASRDEVGGLQAVACGENAVARGRGAAALDVAENGDAGLEAGALLDLVGQRVADA